MVFFLLDLLLLCIIGFENIVSLLVSNNLFFTVITPPPNILTLPEFKYARRYREVFGRGNSPADAYKFDVSKLRWRE